VILSLHANTADENIKAQDAHLGQRVAAGAEEHRSALNDMKGRWKHPISGMGWYRAAKRDFAARPSSYWCTDGRMTARISSATSSGQTAAGLCPQGNSWV